MEHWPNGNRVSSWVRLQRSSEPDELLGRLVEGLWEFPQALDEGFRETLHAWAQELWGPMVPGSGGLPPRAELEKDQGAEEMTTLLEANLNKWKAGVLQEGMAQGLERGRTEARADQRAQLRRQAGRKFGGRAADRLSALIEGVSDPERLAEVGDWIIDCATEAEFLARAERRG